MNEDKASFSKLYNDVYNNIIVTNSLEIQGVESINVEETEE